MEEPQMWDAGPTSKSRVSVFMSLLEMLTRPCVEGSTSELVQFCPVQQAVL